MSDQVASGGPGWSVRVREDAPPAAAPAPPTETPSADIDPEAPIGTPGTDGGFMDGTWVAGVGWVAADHPYATGQARPPGPRRRRRGILAVGPTSVGGRIAFRFGVSACLGLVFFGLFGWHSWITDLFHGRHSVTTPATIAGEPLVTTGPLADLSSKVGSFLGSQPFVNGFGGGFYALPGASVPSYGVFALHHDQGRSLTGGDESGVIDDISGGRYQGTRQTVTDSGVTYTCGNVAIDSKLGVACVWDDYDVAGFIIDFGDDNVDGVMSLAKIVRGAIENQSSTSSST